MRSNKPTPMTDAERQRKHRLKRQRELQALRAVVPATPQERESVAQVQRLAAQLDKATRTAAALQARINAMQAGEGNSQSELQALRESVRSLIPKLTQPPNTWRASTWRAAARRNGLHPRSRHSLRPRRLRPFPHECFFNPSQQGANHD